MNKNKSRMIAGVLSAALMISVVGGGVPSLTENGGKGIIVEASTNSGSKSEAELRKIVLGKYPGTVLRVKKKYKKGRLKYEYKIRQSNGVVVEVEIYDNGYITDVDYEGQYINGIYYDWD